MKDRDDYSRCSVVLGRAPSKSYANRSLLLHSVDFRRFESKSLFPHSDNMSGCKTISRWASPPFTFEFKLVVFRRGRVT
jgi:hypothetical protein